MLQQQSLQLQPAFTRKEVPKNRQRVEMLSNRLTSIQKGLAEDRNQKYRQFADDLETLSGRISDMQQNGAADLEEKRTQIESLTEMLEGVDADRTRIEGEVTESCNELNDNLQSASDTGMEVSPFSFFC